MKSTRRKRRKTLFLALGLVCILITVGVIFLRQTPSEDSPPEFPSTSDRKPESGEKLISTPKPSASPNVFQSASVTARETPNPNPRKEAMDIPPTNSRTGTLTPLRPAPKYTSRSLAIAVVDVERLFAELLPDAPSPETRAQTIRDIQRATSRLAAAHNLDLVFDTSGKSVNNLPVISSAAGVADLTEEVRQELTK